MTAPVVLTFVPAQFSPHSVARLQAIASNHKGTVPIYVRLADAGVCAPVWCRRVRPGPALTSELRAAFGPDAVTEAGAA
jgi:hypothetical protein